MEIRRRGQRPRGFLRRLLPFKAGVPRHDTLNDVVNAIDGAHLAQCFASWVETPTHPVAPGARPCMLPRMTTWTTLRISIPAA